MNGPVNLVRLMQVPDRVDRPDLKFPPFVAGIPHALSRRPDIFAAIRNDATSCCTIRSSRSSR